MRELRIGHQRATLSIPVDVLAKARAMVRETPGQTLAGMVTDLLRAEIARREGERGKPFEISAARLPVGRPRTIAPGTPLPPRPKPIMTIEELMQELDWVRGR